MQVGEALNTVAGKLYDSDGNYTVDWNGIKTISSEDLPSRMKKILTLGNLCEETLSNDGVVMYIHLADKCYSTLEEAEKYLSED